MIIQGLFRLNSIVVIMEIKLLQLIDIVALFTYIFAIEFDRIAIKSLNTFLVHDNERIFLALNDNSRSIQ